MPHTGHRPRGHRSRVPVYTQTADGNRHYLRAVSRARAEEIVRAGGVWTAGGVLVDLPREPPLSVTMAWVPRTGGRS